MTELSETEREEIETEREEIWAEGHRDFNKGVPEHGNPYRSGTLEHELWSDGWEDGCEDEQQAACRRQK